VLHWGTGVQVVLGETICIDYAINVKRMFEVPVGKEWRLPLVHSLLELDNDDDETEIVTDVLLGIYFCWSCNFPGSVLPTDSVRHK
jgi:hypothetical protein